MALIAQTPTNTDTSRATKQAEEDNKIEYTLFASGLNHGGQNILLDNLNITNDVAIIFDVVDRHNYGQKGTKSSYPIESKSKASDHIVIEDGKFSFSARISDSPMYIIEKNFLDRDTNPENPLASKRPAKSLEILTKIFKEGHMVTLVTEDNILTNYVITSLDASRSTEDGAQLVYSIEMEEFRVRQIGRTVLGKTADPRKATNKNKGAVQTADGGAVDDNLKGRRTPFLTKKGGYGDWLTEKYEQVTGEKFDTNVAGDKIVRPGDFNPNSLARP